MSLDLLYLTLTHWVRLWGLWEVHVSCLGSCVHSVSTSGSASRKEFPSPLALNAVSVYCHVWSSETQIHDSRDNNKQVLCSRSPAMFLCNIRESGGLHGSSLCSESIWNVFVTMRRRNFYREPVVVRASVTSWTPPLLAIWTADWTQISVLMAW